MTICSVGLVVAQTIALMRCAKCGHIMTQGERERGLYTPEGRPLHVVCTEDKR